MTTITSVEELRRLYRRPSERALHKQLSRLDEHCRRFIELSRFVVIASGDREGSMDASPRGGEPGFVKVQDERTLLVPDWPGSNRLDSYTNILVTGTAGLLFFVPGVDELLRVNGKAELSIDGGLRSRCAERDRQPPLVVVVTVREAFLHHSKSLERSCLWDARARIDRALLPSLNEMLVDQVGSKDFPESGPEMLLRDEESSY